jgi:hypothetical protein
MSHWRPAVRVIKGTPGQEPARPLMKTPVKFA